MSLIGNLEDLSLPDILQIISLSRKSGILIIHRGDEEGRIYLRQGKVMHTTSGKCRRNIGNILLEKKLITEKQLADAVAIQKQGGKKELLGAVFVKEGVVDQEALEKIVQEQIEETVFYFLTWKEGTFKFELRDVDDRFEVGIDPQALIAQKGIDTQWLVLEGTRIIDERKRKAAEEKPQATSDIGRGSSIRNVTLIDDDDYFSDLFVAAVEKKGVACRRISGVVEAKEILPQCRASGELLAIDVVMPTSDGRGFLGGMELVRLITETCPEVKFRVITAYPDDSIQEELARANVSPYLLKPDIRPGRHEANILDGFIAEILGAAVEAVTPQGEWEEVTLDEAIPPPPAAEPPLEEPPASPAPAAAMTPVKPEDINVILDALRQELRLFPSYQFITDDLIQEIQAIISPSEAGLIILRMAAEILDRAILFKISGEQAVSLGGFGFEPSTLHNRDGLRNLSLGLSDSPLLRQVVWSRKTITSEDQGLAENDILGMLIGRPMPTSWIAMSADGPSGILVLYGDDGGSGKREIPGYTIMELFLVLSGLIMNKIVYERETAKAV